VRFQFDRIHSAGGVRNRGARGGRVGRCVADHHLAGRIRSFRGGGRGDGG
jgi:hypothetical protein